MTKEEALKIPELKIFPNDFIEDCFYYRLSQTGRLTSEKGQKALERIRSKESDPCYKGSFIVADLMLDNLDRYGVLCAAWCP